MLLSWNYVCAQYLLHYIKTENSELYTCQIKYVIKKERSHISSTGDDELTIRVMCLEVFECRVGGTQFLTLNCLQQ